MQHQIPKVVADTLKSLYLAYQHDLSVVTAMLGIHDGQQFSIDFDKGMIDVSEPNDTQKDAVDRASDPQ